MMFGATGNDNYGWFGGGYSPSNLSTIDRIDYSSDTATASVKGPLNTATSRNSANGNIDVGYFGGGEPGPHTRIERIDFSNDTATGVPKGPLAIAAGQIPSYGGGINALPQFGG